MFLENEGLGAIPKSGSFLTLENNYRWYTNYLGTSNPSMPDYCAITSGSNLGCGKADPSGGVDNPTSVWGSSSGGWAGSKPNIFTSIAGQGYSWKSYEQLLDGSDSFNHYTGFGSNFPGFGSRHCPAQFYSGTFAKPTNAPLTNGRFDFSGSNGLVADIANKSLPDFFWITPTQFNQGHLPSTPANANAFLAGSNPGGDATPFPGVTALINGMRVGGLLLITYDNVGGGSGGPNLFAVICGPGVTSQSIATSYSHYSMVKGLGVVFGFGVLGSTSGNGTVDARYTAAAALPLPPGTVVTGDTTPPSPPTSITATAVSSSSIQVAWSGATDNVGVTGYTVSRNGTAVATPTASPFTDTGLTPSTSYSYTVLARDAAGNVSVASAAAVASTLAASDTTAPTVPTGLAASNITASSATLTWTPSTDTGGSGLAGYNVFQNGVQSATVTSPTFAPSLTPSTAYTFTVQAVDGAGNKSAQSTSVSFTTPAIVVGGNVAFRSSTDFNSGTTLVAVNPTHAVNGDTMFAHATAVGATGIVPPSGWTLVGATNDSTAVATAVYQKTAASETTATWTCTGATSLTVEISYVIGSCAVRVVGATNSAGTATVTNVGAALSGLQVNDEVCTWISSNAGPRPYPDTGCGFGFMTPHDWTDQADVTVVENTVTRKIAVAHHQVPWDCHVGASNGDFSTAAQAPKVDYNNNRLSYLSWPRQLAGQNASETSWNSVFGNGDPLAVFQGIQAGTYDGIIDANATAYKTAGLATGAHFIIRLFWEMNGGGVIFTIGKTANVNAYLAAYNPACQRIIDRTKAIAKNVSFHWNPQNFQTTAISRDQLYWGDTYADFVGIELYTGAKSIGPMMAETSSNGHTYPAIYSGYGPGSSHNKFLIAGEGGPQANHTAGESDATVAARVQDYIDTIPTFPGLKQFTWWNGSGSGTTDDSIFTDLGTQTLAKTKTLIASSYMSPNYTTTWKSVT